MSKLHRSPFIKELKERYPFLRDELNEESGLLSLEVAVFRRFVQQQIDAGDRHEVQQAFLLIEKYYLHGNHKLQNSLALTLIGRLNFTDGKQSRQWAWAFLTSDLQKVYKDVQNDRERFKG